MMIIYLSGINLALGGGYHAILYYYNIRWSLAPPFHPYLFRGGITFCCPFIRKITPSQLTLAPISRYSRPTQSPDFPPLPSSKSNHLGILAPLIILFFSLLFNQRQENKADTKVINLFVCIVIFTRHGVLDFDHLKIAPF